MIPWGSNLGVCHDDGWVFVQMLITFEMHRVSFNPTAPLEGHGTWSLNDVRQMTCVKDSALCSQSYVHGSQRQNLGPFLIP